jgi:predicted secreted protein
VKPSDTSSQARRNRTLARGYRSLRSSKAKLYEAAADALQRVEARGKTLPKPVEQRSRELTPAP